MVQSAYVGSFAVGVLMLAAIFALIAQNRVSPALLSPSATAGTARGPQVWARRARSPTASAIAFLVGGVAVAAAGALIGWGWPVGGLETVALRPLVAFLAGGAVAAASWHVATSENDAATWATAFVLVTAALGALVVLAVAGGSPMTNVWTYVALVALLAVLSRSLFAFGDFVAPGTAGAVLVVSTVIFVLILVGITVRTLMGGGA